MPFEDSFSDFVVGDTTLKLPRGVGAALGLSERAEVRSPEPPPDDRVNQWLATKQAEYERFGASPEQIQQWQDGNRQRYERFVNQPGVARIAQSTGPMGTIGQIEETAIDPAMYMPDEAAPPAPVDPNVYQPVDPNAYQPEPAIPPPPPEPTGPVPPEMAGADLLQQGIEMHEQAARQKMAADKAAADSEQEALAARNRELEAKRAETAKQQAQWDKRLEKIQGNVTKTVDDWANHKIDPGRRWRDRSTGNKIGSLIAVAMTALGDALQRKNGPNAAMEMILKSIDDDISLQVSEREHKGQIAQRARTSLDDYRQEYGDWQQARQAKLAEEYQRTADEIERIAAQSKSDQVKARGFMMVGDLRSRAGDLKQGIALSAWNREMKMAEIAEQRRHARVAESQGWANVNLRKQEIEESKKQREAAATAVNATALAKMSAEEQKVVRESGIKDPTTGQYIVGDNGKPLLERNVSSAEKTQDVLASTQTLLSQVDDIKAKIVGDPGFAKLNATQRQAALSAALDQMAVLLKQTYQMGALDKGLLEFTSGATGGDPTKITGKALFGALGLGAESGDVTTAKLDEVAKTAERGALNRLGNPKNFKFTRAEKLEQTPVNKAARDVQTPDATLAGRADEGDPGSLAKLTAHVFTPFTADDTIEGARERASGPMSFKYPAFSKDKEAQLDVLVQSAKAGDAQAQSRFLEMVKNRKVKGLSSATLSVLRVELPDLYEKAVEQLPEKERGLVRAFDAAGARAGTPWGIRIGGAPDPDKALEGIPEHLRPTYEAAQRRQAGGR